MRRISSGDLLNVDFFVDLLFDLRLNENYAIRAGAGHTSQHLSDDALKKFGNLSSINYVRDYYQLFLIRSFPQHHLTLYGGVYYNHNFKTTQNGIGKNDSAIYDKSGTPLFQAGFEHTPFRVSETGFFFWSADVKFRGNLIMEPRRISRRELNSSTCKRGIQNGS